jgi:xanthine dehydrogenase molybdopterin binding subunit/xanthine dehydrogenase small subunit
MNNAFEFTLNGRCIRVENASPNLTLLQYLRSIGLTGSKEGCAEGDCGACSVAVVDRDRNERACYRAINSCLVPVCLLANREVISVEGVAFGKELHPVQKNLVSCHGSQCGYCTPGIVLSLLEGYYRGDIQTQDQLDDQLSGNLCRCTGYRPIREAAIAAFAQRHKTNGQDALAQRLAQARPEMGEVRYQAGSERFFRPKSLPELFQLTSQQPDARLISGATELGLEITKRNHRFPALISLEAIPELKEITETESEWRIGAAATLTAIEEQIASEYPALGAMLRVFGSRQIRNRATMGGNLVTASPIGDCAPVLLSLDARLVLASSSSERVVPIDQFFLSYRRTALLQGEILKSILVPRFRSQPGLTRICQWYKVSKRREMDISTVAACFRVEVDEQGNVREGRLAYGGVAATPVRALATEAAILGKRWPEEALAAALGPLGSEFTPITDVRGHAEYRRGLITSLFERFCSMRPDSAAMPATTAWERSLISWPRGRPGPGGPPPHESGHKHVTGEALYTDDQSSGKTMLEVWPVCSPHARARINRRDIAEALRIPGIRAVLLAEDIPGINDTGTKKDEPLLAFDQASYHGQAVALVVGDSLDACRAASAKVVVDYEPLKPILTIEQAIEAASFHNEPNFMRRGLVDLELSNSPLSLEGTFELGGQEHFYLETHAASAEPGEDDTMAIWSSTQHPSEVQMVVAHLLNLPNHKVVVQCQRMGGGFGGKETQAAMPAAFAALAARITGKPVRVRFDRDQDMILTGHRHPFLARYKVGFDGRGRLLAARVYLYSNGGWAMDLSQAVTDRALSHLDNAYYIPSVEFRGQVAKTNLASNTAFRGFGGPQGMLVIEEILDCVARSLGLAPEIVRERNLYRGKGETNTTHYGQEIGDNRIQTIWRELKRTSSLIRRRAALARWNKAHPKFKRGLAITPVKFGISFTVTHLNQAGAYVLLFQDGTAQINHGGTEMGQGIHTNIARIAALELGLPADCVRVMATSTDKVPNTSATAASCGTDLNGAAVRDACETLRQRLLPVAAELLSKKRRVASAPRDLVFVNGSVFCRSRPRITVSFAEVVRKAYLQRMSLSAAGYYATPGIEWDRTLGRGRPFHYFACGAAVAEVEVDGFTGMARLLRVDILHDAGDSINEGVNRGQIEGGYIQGLGWLTTEELLWDDTGRLLTHSPDTYKIPSVGDAPGIFNVSLLKNASQPDVVRGSKAVGEPPLMLAISAREAIRDAIAAFGSPGGEVRLASPATSEAIFSSIQARLKREISPAISRTRPARTRVA